MGLSEVLTDLALRRAHVLLVEVPGWWTTRVAAQRALAGRGWREAWSPADADVLLVCGDPGERLARAVGLVWDQLPGPRARGTVTRAADVDAALEEAAASLRDLAAQREDARTRGDAPDGDLADGDHGDHGDHGDMEMSPGGVPLAGAGEDRDGLEMDVLHVPLGPVLPRWPAGLVLTCTMQGDVVVEAHAEVLPAASAPPPTPPDGRQAAARRIDRAVQVLALAGADVAATRLTGVRDDLVVGAEVDGCRTRLERARRTVGRSRSLRWSLRDLTARASDGPYERLLEDLAAATDLLAQGGTGAVPHPQPDVGPEALARLVTGLELASVRLVVAGIAGAGSAGPALTVRSDGA